MEPPLVEYLGGPLDGEQGMTLADWPGEPSCVLAGGQYVQGTLAGEAVFRWAPHEEPATIVRLRGRLRRYSGRAHWVPSSPALLRRRS